MCSLSKLSTVLGGATVKTIASLVVSALLLILCDGRAMAESIRQGECKNHREAIRVFQAIDSANRSARKIFDFDTDSVGTVEMTRNIADRAKSTFSAITRAHELTSAFHENLYYRYELRGLLGWEGQRGLQAIESAEGAMDRAFSDVVYSVESLLEAFESLREAIAALIVVNEEQSSKRETAQQRVHMAVRHAETSVQRALAAAEGMVSATEAARRAASDAKRFFSAPGC